MIRSRDSVSGVVRNRVWLAVAALAMAAICGLYVVQNRYYLRFIPIPVEAAAVLRDVHGFLPTSQYAEPEGKLDLGGHDLRTEDGLRRTLNTIQELSPTDFAEGMPSYVDLTFDKWVEQVAKKPIFCTDGTQLMILAAWQQGLPAREWQLLPPGWPPGAGHSVAEYFNSATGRWQLVDGQHAAIIRDEDGQIMDMVSVLNRFKENPERGIVVDYGSYRDQILKGSRGATVEEYFYGQALLNTPVLRLTQPSWFASVERRYGMTGHFVIGYPVIMNGWTHDYRVWASKAALIVGLAGGLTGILLLLSCARHGTRSS